MATFAFFGHPHDGQGSLWLINKKKNRTIQPFSQTKNIQVFKVQAFKNLHFDLILS
jgi:hypothetical protein